MADPVRDTVGGEPPYSQCPEPIAIVGMGCRWPAGVSSPSELWELLKEKRDGWAEFSPDRINVDGFYHPNGQRPGSMVTKGGYVLREDPRQFDHAFFGISAVEARAMDPSQRKLLEVTYEAFDSAGEPLEKLFGSKTGVFVGNFNNDHQLMQFRDPDHTLPYVVTGGGPTILSNRINYVFNLQGPSLVVDTGCSASMYALHLAVMSLRNGDCDAAVVAGGNLILGPDAQIFTTKLGAVSPTSRCHTFDAAADGYARAEGFGAIYLKKISDALAQGNPIRAVIRGTAYNANGKTGGISHPSPEGQEAVIMQAYKAAGGLNPDLTGYFECHGTGTPVGDPIEIAALGRVFAPGRQSQPLLIGSVKPNLGHSEPASAMAQIMKVILALEHGLIPATIGIERFNPGIDFEGAKVKVVTETTSWPRGVLRRVSINSFGYGGANAHCILDHPSLVIPQYQLQGFPLSRRRLLDRLPFAEKLSNGRTNEDDRAANDEVLSTHWCQSPILEQSEQAGHRSLVLLPFSAYDDRALKANVAVLSRCLDDFDLADVLYTLGCRRSNFSRRAFTVVGAEDLLERLDPASITFGKAPRSPLRAIGFVFTGQGAQWPEMGAKLIQEYAVFRRVIRYLDGVLGQLHRKPSWTIEEALLEPAATSRIHDPAFSQTVCTALQIGLVGLLKQWRIQPAAVVGHSEIAAAYAAGRLRASEAIVLAYFRGQLVSVNQRKGQMLAVGLGTEHILPYLRGIESYVTVAAVNSPQSVTLSGEPEVISNVAAGLSADNVFNRVLKTGENAYHSHHMLALGEPYEKLARQGLCEIEPVTSREPARPSVKWISSVTPKAEIRAASPEYWRKNLESPVLFSEAAQLLAQDVTLDLLIEIGPHPALGGPLKQIRSSLESRGVTLPSCLATLRRGEDDIVSMLNLAGNLFLNDASIDLVAVNATEKLNNGTERVTNAMEVATTEDEKAINNRIYLQHGNMCIDMPNYQFSYPEKPVYFENRFNKEFRTRKHLRHDLLGVKQPGGSRAHPSWRNVLRLRDLPWLEDHKLLPHVVLPAAVYIAMAVEACRQIHYETGQASPIKSFKLRSVAINSTLRLTDDEIGVETVLNMERISLTEANVKSRWYKFSIGSMAPDTDSWTEHCSGTIRAETGETTIEPGQRLQADPSSRPLDIKRWYEKFREIGLEYGPTFQGLSKLRAYRGATIAAAEVARNPTAATVRGGESNYVINPATLDTCIQLALIACHAGQVENINNAFVPVHAEDISIWVPQSAGEEAGCGVASGKARGLRAAYARTQLYSASDAPLLDIGELKCVTYDGISDIGTKIPREPYWRPVTRVDITTLTSGSAKAMFPPSQVSQAKLGALDILCAEFLADIKAGINQISDRERLEHLSRFTSWVYSQRSSSPRPTLPLSKEAMLDLQDIPEARCIKLLHEKLDSILRGDTDGVKLLTESGLVQELDTSGITVRGAYTQLRRLVDLLAHKNPRMRVLEIGARTGGATAAMLDVLASNTTFKRLQEYVFTDPAKQFVSDAQPRFNGYHGVSFRLLDIRKDPTTQGFEPKSFDLIISTGSLGQIIDAAAALKHVRSLLKPGGRLAFLEVTRPKLSFEILTHTLNTLDGRWDGTPPCRNEKQWQRVLEDGGFSGLDISLDDYIGDQAMSTVMLSTATQPVELLSVEAQQQQDIYLIYRDYPPPLACAVAKQLAEKGFRVFYANLLSHCELPPNSHVISLVDIESITILSRDEEHFKAIQGVIAHASPIVWIAASDAATHGPAEPAAMKGMLRSVATENALAQIAFIELSCGYLGSLRRTAELIICKLAELQISGHAGSEGGGGIVDRECILRESAFYIDRLLPDEALNEQFRLRNGLEEAFQELPVADQRPLRAYYQQPGILSSVYFGADPTFGRPLPDDWIEIMTEAIGLNMKDLAVATAKFDLDYLSTEAAGIVSKVGSAVTSLKVGDRVFGMIPSNMGNYMRSPASLVSHVPAGESAVGAASIPVAYLTALYALRHLGRLTKEESVLIQSATGGLGMAAIRVAQSLGAEIYATVGNDEKRRLLTDRFGIPAAHVFNSRELTTVDDIMRATGGVGIDVILSSSGGDLMHETWRCIAPLGRFIDVGRTDVLGGGKLGLNVFKRNAVFASFDMGALYRQKPALIERLMKELNQLWRDGTIGPIEPITKFDISQLEPAMTSFSKGLHTGKLVITFDKPEATLKIMKTSNPMYFDQNAAYILAGCLGGLGRSIAAWMVERGARHLIFLSRSGVEKTESTLLLQELTSLGALPEVIKCDITKYDPLLAAVDRVRKRILVKGIIHGAMVEDDRLFSKASFAQVRSVLAPKVTGTINLHEATKHIPLDFFLMTSSLVGTVGTATQSAYAAANAFQDAFARFRIGQSLPATSLAVGIVLEVGSVSDSIKFQEMFKRNASYGVSETEFLQLLEGALCQSPLSPEANVPLLSDFDSGVSAHIIASLEPARYLPYVRDSRFDSLVWHNHARFQVVVQAIFDRAHAHAAMVSNSSNNMYSPLSQRLDTAASSAEKTAIVREVVVKHLVHLLGGAEDGIDVEKPMSLYSFDSLVAAELRNWLIKTFGVDVTLFQLLSKATKIKDLVKMVVETSGRK